MSQHFIIDGYNLIKQTPLINKVNLEDSRAALIRLLSIYHPQGSNRNRVTIVFDGKEGNVYSRQNPFIEIIFTQDESADDKIKRMVEKSKNPKNIVVVTNDRDIQFFVRQHRAKVKTVEEFLIKGNGPLAAQGKVDDKIISPTVRGAINEEMKKIWLK